MSGIVEVLSIPSWKEYFSVYLMPSFMGKSTEYTLFSFTGWRQILKGFKEKSKLNSRITLYDSLLTFFSPSAVIAALVVAISCRGQADPLLYHRLAVHCPPGYQFCEPQKEQVKFATISSVCPCPFVLLMQNRHQV